MSEPPPHSQAPRPEYVARSIVSRERFDKVPGKRAMYIGLYVVSFILWAIFAFYSLKLASDIVEHESPLNTTEEAGDVQSAQDPRIEEAPAEAIIHPLWIRAVRILIAICIGFFFVPFISVLRTMGYPWVGILAFCVFVLAPIPGILIVAYMDTRIAKAWNKADLMYQDSIAAAAAGD